MMKIRLLSRSLFYSALIPYRVVTASHAIAYYVIYLGTLLSFMLPAAAQRTRPTTEAEKNQNPIVAAVAKGDIEQVTQMLDQESGLISQLSAMRSTLLHYAVTSRVMPDETRRAAMVALLLDRGADPNSSGPNLVFTPLIHAVRNGDRATVELLLAKKADPSKPDLKGDTPLYHALQLESGVQEITGGIGAVKAGIVDALLKAGVDLKRWDSRGRYPLHLAAGSAASDPALVAVMLANGADINVATRAGTERISSERSPRGLRPLHLAAESGNIPVVQLLLEKGADINVRSEAGDTPLHRAARVGSRAIETLLAAKANPNLKNGVGDTALHLALRASRSSQTSLKALIVKSDLGIRDRYDLTPLLLALVAGDKSARDLLAVSRSDNSKTDAAKIATAFDAAAQNDVPRLTKLLVEQPYLVSNRLSIGWTPLHIAALWGAKDTTRLLLDKGAEVDARDGQGATPLLRALQAQTSSDKISNDTRQVVDLLLSKGANVNAYASTEPPAYAGNGWRSHLIDTPLNRAIVAGDKELVALFLDKGANIRDRTEHFDTPLLVAVKSGQTDIVPLLLKAGADVDARDEVSMTALTRSLSNSNFDLARVLIEADADVNIGDANGTTPLMWAAMRGSMEMAKLLIEHKADVTARTRSGESAIGAAKRYRATEMIEFLKQNGVPE